MKALISRQEAWFVARRKSCSRKQPRKNCPDLHMCEKDGNAMSRHFECERIDRIRLMSEKRLFSVVRSIVDELSSERATRLGMEKGLMSLWDEFAAQVAVEQNDLFEIYEEYVESICMTAARKLPTFDLQILALFCDTYVEWWLDRDEDRGRDPSDEEVAEWVGYDLFALVLEAAEAEGNLFLGGTADS
ncbi:hypothetical protein [Methylocystis sp. ATCC 49242]|uniref:hypothetical protein n=1 Tax=Methylocystis sp. ATCC 49242 TaxID=622637 RepID=UPI001186CE76|nr:hypothetical protein [Methylocystis sp. ATCC 49242]